MKVSYHWLKERVPIQADAKEIARTLTMAGTQLESIQEAGSDLMLDFEVTVNRPDCLSIHGLARELAALYQVSLTPLPELPPVQMIEIREKEGSYPQGQKKLKIILEDPDLCPRYCGQIITGVKVGPSPEWLRKRLEACGFRSISNVVDITNYVLLELGQPLHAFDYDKLAEGTIRVRRARNEKLVLIDGKERQLLDPMLVIADANNSVAVAGVMGGKDSEVSDATTAILLESAYFQPISVRKTAKQLELSTDASFRFERGVDYKLQSYACRRASALLEQIAGGKAHPILDVNMISFSPNEIDLRPARIERVLGEKIPTEFSERALKDLGFFKKSEHRWEVPSFRIDVALEIDLIEEIARLYGYNKFADTLPEAEKKYQPDYSTFQLERDISLFLRAARMDEAYTYSVWNPNSPYVSQEKGTRIINPVTETGADLRTSLIPNLLESVEYNLRHRNREVRLFEIGHVFKKEGEKTMLGIAILGEYRELKGIIEAAMPALHYAPPVFRKGKIFVSDHLIGELKQLSVETSPVQVCEISLSDLITIPVRVLTYEPINPYPFVERDASLLLSDAVTFEQIEETIKTLQLSELRSFALIDRYQGQNTPPGVVSLTFRFTFQATGRTLTSEEVDRLYARIVDAFAKDFGAELRK